MIRVLVAENNTQLSSTQLDLLFACLPVSIIESSKRYRRWQDAQAFILGRYLLLQGLQRFGYEKQLLSAISYTPYKKPYLPVPLDFNISHSGKYVVCALTSTGSIGIDIEAVRTIDTGDFASCFSSQELLAINTATDRHHQFFTYWTIKEAAIKADGRGMHIPLHTITITNPVIIDQNTWFIHAIDIDPDYQVHLATSQLPAQPVAVERVMLNV